MAVRSTRALVPRPPLAYFSLTRTFCIQELRLESHGPLGTLWVGLGLGCFYIALIWLNTLLGFVLTPLFGLPLTWLRRSREEKQERRSTAAR